VPALNIINERKLALLSLSSFPYCFAKEAATKISSSKKAEIARFRSLKPLIPLLLQPILYVIYRQKKWLRR